MLAKAVAEPKEVREARSVAALRNAAQALNYVLVVGADLLPEEERDELAVARRTAGMMADYLAGPNLEDLEVDDEADL